MSLIPITDEVPVVDATGQCALCGEVYPFVNILTCRKLKGGDFPLCLTCHQRFHPACTIAQSVLSARHSECGVCGSDRASVVCALCSTHDSKDEILEGVLMCQDCSDQIHTPAKGHHRDHFYPVASLDVVPVRGPVQWHNFIDLRCEISANQVPSRASHAPPRPIAAPQPPPPPPQPVPVASSNQHRDSNGPRGSTSSLKHLVIGGSSSQSSALKRKANGGPFERFGRVV